MTSFGPENDASSELWTAVRIFKKFCTMKGAKRYMKIILMSFTIKLFLKENGSFCAQKKTHGGNSGSGLRT